MEEGFDLKKVLGIIQKRSDADAAEWADFQESERQKLNTQLRNLSDVDVKVQHGLRAVEMAKARIPKVQNDPAALEFELDRMAEGYALQGDFEMAASIAHDESKRADYASVLEAINRPDNAECGCPKTVKSGKNTLPTTFIKDKFKSKNGGVCILYHCTICGFTNAKC